MPQALSSPAFKGHVVCDVGDRLPTCPRNRPSPIVGADMMITRGKDSYHLAVFDI